MYSKAKVRSTNQKVKFSNWSLSFWAISYYVYKICRSTLKIKKTREHHRFLYQRYSSTHHKQHDGKHNGKTWCKVAWWINGILSEHCVNCTVSCLKKVSIEIEPEPVLLQWSYRTVGFMRCKLVPTYVISVATRHWWLQCICCRIWQINTVSKMFKLSKGLQVTDIVL